MKRYITVFALLCAFFLGAQTVTAQESAELKAKNRTIKLEKSLELNTTQIKQVYAIFLELEKENSSPDAEALTMARKKISDILQPKQREEFYKSFKKEHMRQEKITEAKRRG